MTSFDRVKQLAFNLPEVEESTSYGTPALKVRGKLMARMKEDSETLVLRTTWNEREKQLADYPEAFFLTDHYRNHPWVLLRLKATKLNQLKAALALAWRESAPKSLTSARSVGRIARAKR